MPLYPEYADIKVGDQWQLDQRMRSNDDPVIVTGTIIQICVFSDGTEAIFELPDGKRTSRRVGPSPYIGGDPI